MSAGASLTLEDWRKRSEDLANQLSFANETILARDRQIMAFESAAENAAKMAMESTPAMRARLKELASPPRDDFDGAVLAVLVDMANLLDCVARP